jgi:hypothetical protein
MKPETFSWDLIERDPLLRTELGQIERLVGDPEKLVTELIGFYGKVDKMVKLMELICEEV